MKHLSMLIVLVLAAALVVGTLVAQPRPLVATPPKLTEYDIIELTHPLKEDMPVFPGGEPFQLKKLADISSGYYLNKMSLGEHTGTHVDAPNHFDKGGKSIAELPMRDLTGPAVVIDMTDAVSKNPDYALTVEDLRKWEKMHDEIPANAFVLLRTGWFKRWDKPQEYVNSGADHKLHFPGFSREAAQYLVTERKILGVGVDTLSADPGISMDFAAHHVVLKAGRINIENLGEEFGRMPLTGATLVVAPLRIEKGSGSPARVFALAPKPMQ
jgi:kynurenine formamidase